MQLPGLAIGHLHHGDAEPAENLEVDARISAHVGDAAEQEHRHVGAALHQRARDHESVAAVVAAAAQDRHLPLEEVAVHRLHRRDSLAASVFHEDEGRDADLFDRALVGLAHL